VNLKKDIKMLVILLNKLIDRIKKGKKHVKKIITFKASNKDFIPSIAIK
jgi:hypothetical protein